MKTHKFVKAPSFWMVYLTLLLNEVGYFLKWLRGIKNKFLKAFTGVLSSSDNERSLISNAVLEDLNSKTTISSREVRHGGVAKCFSGNIYKVSVRTKVGGIEVNASTKVFCGFNGKVFDVSLPEHSRAMPELLKVLNANLRLENESTAKEILSALKAAYLTENFLLILDGDEFENRGFQWAFKVEISPGKYSAFILDCSGSGKIIRVMYKAGISPEKAVF